MDLSWGDRKSVVFDGWRICDVGAVVWVGGPGAEKGGLSGIVAYAWEGWHLLHIQFGGSWVLYGTQKHLILWWYHNLHREHCTPPRSFKLEDLHIGQLWEGPGSPENMRMRNAGEPLLPSNKKTALGVLCGVTCWWIGSGRPSRPVWQSRHVSDRARTFGRGTVRRKKMLISVRLGQIKLS